MTRRRLLRLSLAASAAMLPFPSSSNAQPAPLPAFLAPPPGTKIDPIIAEPGRRTTLTRMESPLSPDAIAAYYRPRIVAAGYALDDAYARSIKTPGRTTLHARKDGGGFFVMVITAEAGKSEILITFTP